MKRAYTLIEVIIVIAFVLILAAIVVPAVQYALARRENRTLVVTGKYAETEVSSGGGSGNIPLTTSTFHRYFLATTTGDFETSEALYRRTTPGTYLAVVKGDHVVSLQLQSPG